MTSKEKSKKDFLKYREQGIGSPCNKLFELKIINEYNLTFPEDICLGEDLVFVMKYLKYMSSTIIFLHRKLYIYQNQERKFAGKSRVSI